jgi:hypothetical protein
MRMRFRKPKYLWGVIGLMGAGIVGCSGGGSKSSVDTSPTPAPITDSYNPRVGQYEGVGTLTDGRAVRWTLRAGSDARLESAGSVGSGSGTTTITYNLKDGTQVTGIAYLVELSDGASLRFTHGVPVSNKDGSRPFQAGTMTAFYKRTPSSAEERVELQVTRKNRVLGVEDVLTLLDRSADCNALLEPARFEYLQTWHDVAEAKNGFFSAYAQPGPTDTKRRFSFLIREITRGQISGTVRVGDRVSSPASVTNPVQVNYNEEQSDGTVRQWTAVSGSVVFDAVDSTLPINNPLLGETYQTTGKVSFHFENLRFEASNSTSDPTFIGARGSFILGYAGTSTVGYKRYSRDW